MTPSRKKPAAPPRRYQTVRSAEQIALLASPVRQDLVDTLQALGGEADVAAVASQMGRSADGLYYHFELLADAGLLQRLDPADGARRYRIGRARGTALRLDYGEGSESTQAVARVVDKVLQAARRDFRKGLARPQVRASGPDRELWAGRVMGWVGQRELAEANRLLSRLQLLLQGPRQPGQDQLVSLSFVLAPLEPNAPRASARDKQGG